VLGVFGVWLVGTVRSRIFRAREAIDNKLNPLIGES